MKRQPFYQMYIDNFYNVKKVSINFLNVIKFYLRELSIRYEFDSINQASDKFLKTPIRDLDRQDRVFGTVNLRSSGGSIDENPRL